MSYLVTLKKHKFLYAAFASIAFSFLFYGLKDLSFERSMISVPQSLRKLLDPQIIAGICEKGPDNLLAYYNGSQTYQPLVNKTEDSSDNSTDTKAEPSEYTKLLIDFVESFDIMLLLGYLLRVAPFLVFILFFLITLISWFAFCCCCCCPCCCCKQKGEEKCCKTVSFIVSAVMMAGVLGMALYSVLTVNAFLGGFNGFVCSVLKLLDEINNGQQIETLPKWNGITGILEILSGSIDAITQIKADTNNAFGQNDWITNAPRIFESTLTSAYSALVPSTNPHLNQIQNANPSGTITPSYFTPVYVDKYGPHTQADTALFAIKEEFDARIVEGGKLLKQGEEAAKTLTETDDAIAAITSVSGTIESLSGTFGSFDSFLGPVNDILDLMNQYGNLALLVLFGVMSGFSGLTLVFLLLFGVCHQNWARFILIIIWNFFTLFAIILFLVGGLFGIIGVFALDAVEMAYYLIGKENLRAESPILIPAEVSTYLITCLHDNGDLSALFDLTEASQMDELIKLQKQVDDIKTNVEANEDSISIKAIEGEYDIFRKNFVGATSNLPAASDSFEKQLRALNDLTKSKTNYDDLWVPNETLCTSGYQHSEFSTTSCTSKCCFVVSKWNSASTRYDLTIKTYLNVLKQYESDNVAILGRLTNKNNLLNVEFKSVSGKLVTSIDNINEFVLDPLMNVFKNFIGDNTVFSIVNCKFLGGHINVVLDQLQAALGLNFFNLGVILGSMSFCLFFGIIFLIVTINRCKTIKKKEEKTDDKSKKIQSQSQSPEELDNSNFGAPKQVDSELIQIKKKGK